MGSDIIVPYPRLCLETYGITPSWKTIFRILAINLISLLELFISFLLVTIELRLEFLATKMTFDILTLSLTQSKIWPYFAIHINSTSFLMFRVALNPYDLGKYVFPSEKKCICLMKSSYGSRDQNELVGCEQSQMLLSKLWSSSLPLEDLASCSLIWQMTYNDHTKTCTIHIRILLAPPREQCWSSLEVRSTICLLVIQIPRCHIIGTNSEVDWSSHHTFLKKQIALTFKFHQL